MTPSQVLQNQQEEFEKKFDTDLEKKNPFWQYKVVCTHDEWFACEDRMKVIGEFLSDSHSSLLAVIEEWAKENMLERNGYKEKGVEGAYENNM